MRTSRILSIALAGALLTGGAAMADDHEEQYGPIVIGEESTTGEGWKDLYVEWEWDNGDGTSDYVYLWTYDAGDDELWVDGGLGTCTRTEGGEPDCTSTAELDEDDVDRDLLVIDRRAGTARLQWSTTQGGGTPCEIDVVASFDPDEREPNPSTIPRAGLNGDRVELRRSGSVSGYGDGTARGTICGWEHSGVDPDLTDWSLVYYTEYRTDTTYVQPRV